jgi:hypothetical protein
MRPPAISRAGVGGEQGSVERAHAGPDDQVGAHPREQRFDEGDLHDAQVATAAEDECGAHGVPPSGLPGPCPCDRQAGATVIGETLGAARRSGW